MLATPVFLGLPHPKSTLYNSNFGDAETMEGGCLLLNISLLSAPFSGPLYVSITSLPMALPATTIPFSLITALLLTATVRTIVQFPKYVAGNFKWPLQSAANRK